MIIKLLLQDAQVEHHILTYSCRHYGVIKSTPYDEQVEHLFSLSRDVWFDHLEGCPIFDAQI